MASKTTLNAKNLEALGAERLAELLIEISAGDAVARRRLRMELAAAQSPTELAKEVRKRLTDDFGRFGTHEAYEARLRREHPRKSSFWSLVD